MKPDFEKWQAEREAKYFDALRSFPKRGNGANHALYRVAILGLRAGFAACRIESELNAASCSKVSTAEVRKQVFAATGFEGAKPLGSWGSRSGSYQRVSKVLTQPRPASSPSRFDEIAASAEGTTGVDLMHESPIKVTGLQPWEQARLFLRTMFEPEEFVFCGNQMDRGILGRTIRRAAEWADFFVNQPRPKLPPFIMTNPLNGIAQPKASGNGTTFRGKANVAIFRYTLLEFDNPETQPLPKQAAFFRAADLELAALVFTGGKSLHGWLRVQGVQNLEDWDRIVMRSFFAQVAGPIGADAACKDPCRLARLPGAFRLEKEKTQRLLLLDSAYGPQGELNHE